MRTALALASVRDFERAAVAEHDQVMTSARALETVLDKLDELRTRPARTVLFALRDSADDTPVRSLLADLQGEQVVVETVRGASAALNRLYQKTDSIVIVDLLTCGDRGSTGITVASAVPRASWVVVLADHARANELVEGRIAQAVCDPSDRKQLATLVRRWLKIGRAHV